MIEAAVSGRLTLVSHARTAAVREGRFPADEPLDDHGLRHAAAAAAAGSLGRPPDRVLCDHSARTRQTAQALGLTVEDVVPDKAPADKAPADRAPAGRALADLDVGSWTGRRLADLADADVLAWVSDPAAVPHGGESVLDLLARVAAWLGGLPAGAGGTAGGTAGGNLVAVTHPAVVRAVLVTALRSPPEVFWRIDVAPLTATTLRRRGGWTLRHACRPLA